MYFLHGLRSWRDTKPVQIGNTVKDLDTAQYEGAFKFGDTGRGFYHEKYPHTADIRLHSKGSSPDVFEDQIKGLNAGHAGARAAAAYQGMDRVRVIDKRPGASVSLDLPDDGTEAGPYLGIGGRLPSSDLAGLLQQ